MVRGPFTANSWSTDFLDKSSCSFTRFSKVDGSTGLSQTWGPYLAVWATNGTARANNAKRHRCACPERKVDVMMIESPMCDVLSICFAMGFGQRLSPHATA